MARLNTRSQARQTSELPERASLQRLAERNVSPPPPMPKERRPGGTMTGETLFDKRLGLEKERPQLARSKSTRTRTKTLSEQSFNIFADSDGPSERDTPRPKKATPLKLARTNSMILPLPQQARARTNRKSELYNYDKENDPLEEELDPEPPSLSRNPSDASSTRSPTRNRNTQQFSNYRQPQPPPESEDENDTSSDSLDDFIVSDNDEPSYHETSEDETSEEEEEHKSPPPTQKRRLFRGRRPDPTAEIENALRESSLRTDLRLEPSLPAAISTSSPRRDRVSRKLFRQDTDVSEKMDNLILSDGDPSSQLQLDLERGVVEPEPPTSSQRDGLRFQTPPPSPAKSLLRSPTKEKVRIPPTPYRESTDAFWSLEATNDWIDKHSPRKESVMLEEFDYSESDSETMPKRLEVKPKAKPPSKTALKKAEAEAKKAALARKKSFDDRKAGLAEDFLRALDDAVSGGEVQRRSEDTGGVRIVWSKTLQTTAGRANWKRDRPTTENGPLTDFSSSSGSETPSARVVKQYATIELAERIIDDEDRLINTLAHEYCHLANYMISNVRNQPHGASFQAWGRKCKEALRSHPIYGGRIEVTTKHSYKIDYKYVWTCVDCTQNYGRHSKSIDPSKHRCGNPTCRGLLQQIKPKPRSVSPRKKQPAFVSPVNDMLKNLEVVELSP
ncbi:SprT-like family-domain-containing protein [Aspergillus karnatakaensis]|uniref:SprT family zinc-dependent metalloprotease n=1 Tax=Aspergillus karnatakaensis TaxID=1810916 RepID=UPI003CCD6C85